MPRQSRRTRQKKILQQSVAAFKSFFSADDLYQKSILKDEGIGIATVYRFLKKRRDSGELFSYRCDGKHVYSKKKQSHCHFVCEKTGKVIHFDVDSIDFLQNKIPGKITSFQIEVHGVCDDCDT